MSITVLNDWFLLEVEKYIAALNELRHRTFNALSSISISLGRLILLLLKRTVGIIKNWLKESKVDEWLKTILHESYLGVFEGLYIFLYILHFFRAFLTLINYFTDQDNKNLVEVTKFLYACFKVFISLLMLTFLIVLIAHGFAPLGLIAYEHIKTLFRVYTFSKFAINFLTLGFSFYKSKTCDDSPDHAWLKAQYKNNLKKHTQILVVGGLITLTLTLVSLGLVTGPLFWVMVAVASILLVIDMAKAIYFYVKGCDVPEPEVAILPQQNSLIDYSINDYYYRKCRTARLQLDDPEANRIYLLKEIVVKIIQLENKLKNNSVSRFSFFSEKQKIQEKIDGLIQEGKSLIDGDYEKNKQFFDEIIKSLKTDYDTVDKEDNVLLKTKQNLDINFEEYSKNYSDIGSTLFRIFSLDTKKLSSSSQPFRQSFFRKKGDCEDISDACQKLKELEQPELSTETSLQPFPLVGMTPHILAAG